MTITSKSDLATASHEAWVEWLFGALRAYTADTPAARRVRAFAPLHIDPVATSPVGEIIQALERLDPPPMAAAGKAAAEVVRLWSPNIEPRRGGELALEIATRLGARNLFDATRTLLAKSANLPRVAREDLAFLATKAAEARFRRTEVEQLSQLLWKMDLLTPSLLGDMTLLISREDFTGLEGLPQTLLSLAPGIMTPPHDGKYASAIVNRIIELYPIEEITRALQPHELDTDDEAKMREIFAKMAIPWTRVRLNIVGGARDELGAADALDLAREALNQTWASLDSLGDEFQSATVVPLRPKGS